LFSHFVRPSGLIDDNWLPVYGDTIGVAMSYESAASSGFFRYHIWDVSTWQGICMNYPINAPPPVSIADSSVDFDFDIINKDNYLVKPFNYDQLVANTYTERTEIGNRFKVRMAENARYSYRGWELVKKWTSNKDTLWLRVLDYGAKCMISPRQGSKIQNRMNSIPDVFGRPCYTLSLPRDLDGLYDYGVNYGDGMADVWEANYNWATWNMLPFTQWTSQIDLPVSPTDHGTSDRDDTGQGRLFKDGKQLYGDYLCNFAEYRGFMICGDDSAIYQPGQRQHRRTNPLLKTVFGWISPLIPDTLKMLYPGYISSLNDSMEVFFVDSISGELQKDFYTSLDWRDTAEGRLVTHNLIGCHRFYHGFTSLTNHPILETANAVTFWPDDATYDLYLQEHHLPRQSAYSCGLAYLDFNLNEYAQWPNGVSFITIENNAFSLIDTATNSFYRNNPGLILPAVRGYYKSTIAHEFGHCVGLKDHPVSDPTIMSPDTYWLQNFFDPSSNILVTPTRFTTQDFVRLGIRFPQLLIQRRHLNAFPR